MIRIHPHWESIDDIAVRQGHPPTRVVVASPRSRSTAAIIGIIVVLLLGYFFYRETGSLEAQTVADQSNIHITANGMQPIDITVTSGEEITWINDDDKPHILSSDTLETHEGLLYTSAIFPNESYTVLLTDTVLPGQYDYISLTDPAMYGSVLVRENISSSTQYPFIPSQTDQAVNPPLFETEPSPSVSAPSSIVINPNTITHQTQKPFRQPETGASTWVAGLLGLVVLASMMRRARVL